MKSIIVLLYDFSTMNEPILLSLHVQQKDLLTSFSDLLLRYFNVVFCILNCIYIP